MHEARRDNPAAVAAELRGIQGAIPDVLNLIEADQELDRDRGLGQDECQPTSGEIFSTPKTGREPTRW